MRVTWSGGWWGLAGFGISWDGNCGYEKLAEFVDFSATALHSGSVSRNSDSSRSPVAGAG